jgi:hypothetical protein
MAQQLTISGMARRIQLRADAAYREDGDNQCRETMQWQTDDAAREKLREGDLERNVVVFQPSRGR